MRKATVVLLAIFMTLWLAACNLPRATPVPATQPTRFPTMRIQLGHSTPAGLVPQVQEAMEKAGLKGITATAEAFGEDCIDAQTNKAVSFAAMETDFRISVEVPDLKDTEALGNLLERILIVLDEFPPKSTPGPQSGYIGINFTSDDQDLNMWFLVQDEKAARDSGFTRQRPPGTIAEENRLRLGHVLQYFSIVLFFGDGRHHSGNRLFGPALSRQRRREILCYKPFHFGIR